jgi:hypothetical protein
MTAETGRRFKIVQKDRYLRDAVVLQDGSPYAQLSFGDSLKVGGIACGEDHYDVVKTGLFSEEVRLFQNRVLLAGTSTAQQEIINFGGVEYEVKRPWADPRADFLRGGIICGSVVWTLFKFEADADFGSGTPTTVCLFLMWLATRKRIRDVTSQSD